MDQDEGLPYRMVSQTNLLVTKDQIFSLGACLELALPLLLPHRFLHLGSDRQHLLAQLQSHGRILTCKTRNHHPLLVPLSRSKDLLLPLEHSRLFHQQHPRQTVFLTDLNFRTKL
jgi:hypothetical protein